MSGSSAHHPSVSLAGARAPDVALGSAATAVQTLFVTRRGQSDDFWANIRGHYLDLAHPRSDRPSVPSPDDLFVASIAAELAWSARAFLRERGLPDEVSVAAQWQKNDHLAGLGDIALTVTVPSRLEAVADVSLVTELETMLAAYAPSEPAIYIRLERGGRQSVS